MLPFKLTETALRRNATDKSWERGQQYYRSGSVVNLLCRGNLVQALVEGNEYDPYRITIQADRGGIKDADCTCPYDWGGWCKHIIAVGLACARNPELVEQAPPLDEVLAPLNHEQLETLMFELVDEHPEVMDTIEAIAIRLNALATATAVTVNTGNNAKTAANKQPHQRQTSLDPEPFKRQTRHMIRQGLNECEDGWGEYDFTYDAFPELLATPEEFVQRGDGANARVILNAIAQTCADDWEDLNDYGYEGFLAVQAIDPLLAEALLQAELDGQERIDQQVLLEEWGDSLGQDFELSTAALSQGWDDEDLVAVLQGELDMLWEGEVPGFADELAQIRLRILARQERWEEYLRFSQIEGQDREHLVKLVELGRGEEAIALLSNLGELGDARHLAEAFRKQGDLSGALQVAEYGLNISDPEGKTEGTRNVAISHIHYRLAEWAAQLAEQVEDEELAIRLWSTAIKAQPTLRDFQHLEALAGENWPPLQQALLDYLEHDYDFFHVDEEIQIFLAAERVQAAMTRIEESHNRGLWLMVMTAAVQEEPSWVISQAQTKSGEILSRGKADRYDWAVKFLAQMKAAYLHQQDETGWLREREELMAQHGRKRKFVGLMAQAGL